MAITMKNYGLTWTDTDGVARASLCSYDKASAEGQKEKLVAAKCEHVQIHEIKVGQLLQPQV
ncbi:hypothetical protein [Streptomyces sp. NPDC002853]